MKDEISLKEAAEYTKYLLRRRALDEIEAENEEIAVRHKRERETGEATAVLEAMLAAGRAGKTVKG